MKKTTWENWPTLALGIWTFLTPWLFTNSLEPATVSATNWNFWLVGVAISASAIAALQYLKPWEEWFNMALGVWLILSPWIVGYYAQPNLLWNSIVVGFFVTLFSGIALPTAMKLQQQQR